MPTAPHAAPAGPDQAPPSVAFLLSSLGHQVQRDFAARLRPLGLEPRQFGLLRLIARAGAGTQRSLGVMLGIAPNSMVALVDDLERRGLVERRAHPTDRRAHALGLTGEGARTLDDAIGTAVGVETDLCGVLTGEERDRLLELLGKLAAHADVPAGVHPGLFGRRDETVS
jgi:DNA-binding MarR family transcriptional regulator